MATKNEVDAAETAPTTPTTTVVTPRTQRTGPLLAVIGGSALAAALLLGGGVLLGFNLGHAGHDRPALTQELLPSNDRSDRGPLGDGPRDGDLREVGPRPLGPQQNQEQEEPETDSE